MTHWDGVKGNESKNKVFSIFSHLIKFRNYDNFNKITITDMIIYATFDLF